MANNLVQETFKTETGRLNFIKGLIHIAKCDKNVSPDEQIFFKSAAISLGLDDHAIRDIDNAWNENECYLAFESQKESVLFLREALQLCYVDGSYGESEKELIYNFAENLNVSKSKLSEIEDWVNAGIEWSKKGEVIILSED